jgi:large conductance mechanosensitive channel
MGVLKEFREFAARGNVVDLAVGIVLGAAFTKIVSSAVADLITPPLGVVVGGVSFEHLKVVLREGVNGKPAVTLNIGTFLQAIFDFLIVSAAVFLLVKGINRLQRRPPAAPPPPSREVELLTEIRDALKRRP